MDNELIIQFQVFLLDWFEKNKRIFPWRYTYDPYLVLVSELLLQQTNVNKIIHPYNNITSKYQNIEELSNADPKYLKEIFKEIGLFYRSDRLISISSEIVHKFDGIIPNQWDELINIKGIGNYICSAILCFGYKQSYAVVDTNVIRVIERIFDFKSECSRPRMDKELWEFAQIIAVEDNFVDYNYAVLDFAALICTAYKPKCNICVFKNICCYIK
ncbi:A/G-specific adenine glycosylase [Clostridium botulinum]|nr:A/G-specific adenine glycosylase [Clostridium botulinum]MBO0573718.1 A/G-specific adenine glycosylase [Clostridium botulinum]